MTRVLSAISVLMLSSLAIGQSFPYQVTDPFSSDTSINAIWTQNGAALSVGTSAGLTTTDASGGSLIYNGSQLDGTSTYEVNATLKLTQSGNNDAYGLYLRASSNAINRSAASGTYYAFEIQNVQISTSNNTTTCSVTYVLYERVNGNVTYTNTAPLSQPCNNQTMNIRLVYTENVPNMIVAYVNGTEFFLGSNGDIPSGQPGVAVRNAPAGNGISSVRLCNLDRVAPTGVSSPLISSVFPDHIDLRFGGEADNPGGIGVGFLLLYRNGTPIVGLVPGGGTYTDLSVTPNTQYNYTIQVFDYHLNYSITNFPQTTTPPSGAIDPRQVGVRPLGSYWGATGEQIDMRSGNLNFTMPLIKALGRGGWSVGFNLSYNSQNWREDPGGIWQLGADTGYGYGWKLQAGSLTPIYQDYWTIHHWFFIDSTGAEYRLDQSSNNGTIWTSLEGVYLTFDAGAGRLYFPDGSFWVFGDLSSGTEQDAGTYYPTLIEDTNGNQILLTYEPGLGVSYANSSARIATIEDVRGAGRTDYTFTYNTDTIPHLTGITNSINTSENYTLAYTASSALIQPFASTSNNNFGTFKFLQSLTVNGPNLTTSFTYIPTTDNNTNPPTNGYSGELAQMTTPYGGYLRWSYAAYTLSGSRTFREVQNRYLLMCASSMSAYCSTNGGTEQQYYQYRDPGDNNRTVHLLAEWTDVTSSATKVWIFQTSSGFNIGLQTHYDERSSAAWNNPYFYQDYTWAQTPTSVNPYIGTTVTTLDYAQSYQAQKQSTQTLDQYGNLATMQVYDFGNLSTPARYYFNYYVTDSNYISRHITNRLSSSYAVNGSNCSTASQCTTLVSNSYDGEAPNLTDLPGVYEHDSAYNTSFNYRGNVTGSTAPTATKLLRHDIGGNITSSTVNGVYSTVSTSSTTNYAAPSQMTTNSLSSNMNWTAALGPSSVAGPNGDTASFGYDTNGRPTSTTAPTGAVTNYTYADTASPPYKTATTNTHWVQTAMDGFGRTIQTETGYSGTGVSVVATHYDPCGCSPLGKISQVTEPFAPGGSVYWTNYTYDASGRTAKIALPDSSATIYLYQGNTVKVTDPAGNTKTFTMDAFGNLIKVAETDPNGGGPGIPGTVYTNYTYDILNHLIRVNMPRNTTPVQPDRTFNYIASGTNTVGAYLLTATNPENGTVSYTYSNNLLASKTDAKGQAFTYFYDVYNRPYQIKLNGSVLRTFLYDTNTLDGSFTTYGAGRLVAVQNAQFTPGSSNPTEFTEMYSYTQAGQPNKKRLQTNLTGLYYPYPVYTNNLDTTYTYDNEGKMTSVNYPNAGPTYRYSFDSMSRPVGLTDQNNYAAVSGVQYGGANAPANELSSMNYFGVTETRTYNTLTQMTNVTVGSSFNMTYNYPSGTNNGKISSQKDNLTGETVTYAYDSLNRLLSATSNASPSWSETYGFDAFGNLTTKTPTGGAPQLSLGVDPATNRAIITNVQYDNNGNPNAYNGIQLIQLTYDAENRVVGAPLGSTQYAYDSQNKRVWRGTLSGGAVTAQEVYIFGVDGQKLGTYSLALSGSIITATTTQTAVFFGAKRVAVNGAAFVPDRLGSNMAGKYYPYGEDRGTPIQNDQVKYATYTRDSATGMDYADQRYYSNQFGRFMTDDPSANSWDPANPQSWNTYAHMVGDPINGNDPTGLGPVTLPPIVPGVNCSTAFIDYAAQFGETIQQLFDSDAGILGLMNYFEQQGSGSNADQQVWAALDWVFLDRWSLSASDKAWFYGRQNIPTSFAATVTMGNTRSQVFTSSGQLTAANTTTLLNILTGSPDSNECQGLARAFDVGQGTIDAYNFPGNDPGFFEKSTGLPYITNPFPGALAFGSDGAVPSHSPAVKQTPVGTVQDGIHTWTFFSDTYTPPPVRRPPRRPRKAQ